LLKSLINVSYCYNKQVYKTKRRKIKMKNLRLFSMYLILAMPLLVGTGCQSMESWWPFGGDDEVVEDGAVNVPPAIEDPKLPTEFKDGPVGERAGAWKRRPELKLPTIYFSYDKFLLGAREKNILDQVATYMKKNKALGIIVEGYCDERGSEEYNRALGERRALAVHDYLITIGIPSGRIQTQSYGEERPAVKGTGEAIFAKNRRAELILANM
jgi:peptidoglycan-associated lipoprotein